MGKGDVRSRRGKIYNGSYGKKRPGRPRKPGTPAPTQARAPRGR